MGKIFAIFLSVSISCLGCGGSTDFSEKSAAQLRLDEEKAAADAIAAEEAAIVGKSSENQNSSETAAEPQSAGSSSGTDSNSNTDASIESAVAGESATAASTNAIADGGESSSQETNTEPTSPMSINATYVYQSCRKLPQKTVTEILTFEKIENCSWGTRTGGSDSDRWSWRSDDSDAVDVPNEIGNLSKVQGKIRAHEEQSHTVDLPNGALLCGFNLTSKTEKIRFDDLFAFRVDKFVLAANKNLLETVETSESGHKIWDWSKVVNSSLGDGGGTYCAADTCILPPTDQEGPFELNFNVSESQDELMSDTDAKNFKLFSELTKANKLTFTATATGDNDAGDCYHSGGVFDVKVTYVIP